MVIFLIFKFTDAIILLIQVKPVETRIKVKDPQDLYIHEIEIQIREEVHHAFACPNFN